MPPAPAAPRQVEGGIYGLLGFAPIYEAIQRILGAETARRRLIEGFVQPPPEALVLDIGCGPGTVLAHLPIDARYVGYDENPRYLDAARRRFGPRGEFLRAQAGELPVHPLAGSFDRVLAFAILHHLQDADARSLVRQAFEHLRPGGRLVTVDPALHDDQPLVARWLARADRGKRVRTPEGYRSLVETAFANVQVHLLHDLARVPYSHAVVVAVR